MTTDRQNSARLQQWGQDSLRRQLAGPGLQLDLGFVRFRVRSDEPHLAPQLGAVYRHFTPGSADGWSDLHVSLQRARGVRRWLRPQVSFVADGVVEFAAFPADHALPLMEWGVNWLIGRRMNHLLLLHAGALERDGRALVMPALPGSGKSTLSAALSVRGWRLLSDEFGAFDPQAGAFRAVLKPVALKNESIDVIRRFEPQVELGPSYLKTRKGTVAHLAPSLDAVTRRHETALPGMLVLPRWRAGSATVLEPVPPQVAFSSLAFNSFNYAVLGAEGFRAVVSLVRSMPAWRLEYSNLEDATARLLDVWQKQPALGATSAQPRPAGLLVPGVQGVQGVAP